MTKYINNGQEAAASDSYKTQDHDENAFVGSQVVISERMRAWNAIDDMPLSTRRFFELCAFIARDVELDVSFKKTLRFIRERKLPKAKMLDWLNKHGMRGDNDIITNIWHPIMEELDGEWTVGDEQQYNGVSE